MRKIDVTKRQAATSEAGRQINRRVALNVIRRHTPMSRADLARRSGLKRSMLSTIVDELIEQGWITEGASDPSPRGRSPRFLHLNVERAGIFAVELQPQVTTVGLAGVDARFVAQTSWSTPHTPEAFVRKLARTVTTMQRAHPRVVCEGMGISLPGRVDSTGRLVFAPNLRWGDADLTPLIEGAIGLPVVLENAANACALAELWFGRHPENIRHLLAVTVSDGIGVGLLVNGQLLHGGDAMAGEFGHVMIDEQGPPCRCGKRGCWERYASNSAAVQHYVHGPSAAAGTIPRFEDLLRFADHGDRRAVEALERMARFLGFGLAGLATGLAPEVIVMIGEITAAWDRLGPIVLAEVKKRTLPHVATRILPTDPTTQPRLRGALSLVVQQHFGVPSVA
jgi:predicted NBD/HSP70 family sugar kinase